MLRLGLWDGLEARSALPLRPYQLECFKAVVEAFANGKRSVAVQLPTGTGKTVVFAVLIRAVVEAGGRAMVLVHRDELVWQAVEKLSLVWPGAPEVGIVKAERFEPDRPIVVASVQTLWRRLKRLEEGFDLLVIDEAHHAAARTYRMCVDRLTELNPDMKILGVSATVFRSDNKALSDVFEEVVFNYSVVEAIAQGYLAPLCYLAVETEVDLDGVGFSCEAGDFVLRSLSEAVNTPERNRLVVDAWFREAKGRPTIAFAVDLEHVEALTEAFRAEGVNARAVTGSTPLEERRKVLEDFKKGRVEVLVNCQVLTEGFDAPNASCLLLARPTASRVLYVQMVGRGLRPYPNKEDCLIIDFVDSCKKHSLVSLPCLDPQLERALAFAGGGGTGLGSLRIGVEEAAAILEFNLKEHRLFDPTAYHWVEMSHGWAMSLPGKRSVQVVRVDKKGELYGAFVVDPKEKQVTPLLHRPASLETAFGVANELLRTELPEKLRDKEARWRELEPTERQVELLEILGFDTPPTRGEASDILTGFFCERQYRFIRRFLREHGKIWR